MRESLKKSLAHSPVKNFEQYAKNSIVLCNACGLPIFRLDVAIVLGDGMGKMARAFKPLTVTELQAFGDRIDIEPGVVAKVKSMSLEQRVQHVQKLREVRPGDPALCPVCEQCFVQVVAVEKNEALDKAYTVELLTAQPEGGGKNVRLSGRKVGGKHSGDWLN